MTTRRITRTRQRTSPRVAWLTNHDDRYYTLRMAGFEEPDLTYMKQNVAMRFDPAAKSWIIHRNDARWAREALGDLDFITIERTADDG